MAAMTTVVKALIKADASQMKTQLQGASRSLDDFSKSAKETGRKLSRRLTLPLIGAGAAAIKSAADFESSMTKIQSLVGLSADTVQGFTEDVRRLSGETAQAPKDLADAMFFITSAGLRGAAATETLEAAAKAAAVGLGETATIADLATSALNAYGEANLSATSATDVMVAAVREGKLEASELASSMGRVLPLASAMGVEFNEVGAAFAALSRTGTNASEAATQVRGILSSLLRPTKQARDALSGMGLSAENLREQLRQKGLLATLKTLAKEFKGNEAAAASVFGNIRALSGVLDLMGANVATTEKIFANMTDTTGALSDAFEAQSDKAAFKLSQSMANLKGAFIDIGNVLIPIVVPVIENLTGLVKTLADGFGKLPSPIQKTAVAMAAMAAAAGPLIYTAGLLTGQGSRGALTKLLATVKAHPAAFVAAGVAAVTFGAILKSQRTAAKEAKERMESLREEMIKAGDPTANLTAEIKELATALHGSGGVDEGAAATEAAITNMGIGVQLLQDELTQAGLLGAVKATGIEIEELAGVTRTGTDEFDRLSNSAGEVLHRGLEVSSSKIGGLGDRLAEAGRSGALTTTELILLMKTLDKVADASDDVREQIEAEAKAYLESGDTLRELNRIYGDHGDALLIQAQAMDTAAEGQIFLKEKFEASTEAQKEAERIVRSLAHRTSELTESQQNARMSSEELAGKMLGVEHSAELTADQIREVRTEFDKLIARFDEVVNDAFDLDLAMLTVEKTFVDLATAISELNNEEKTQLKRQTDLVTASKDVAQAISDTIETFDDLTDPAVNEFLQENKDRLDDLKKVMPDEEFQRLVDVLFELEKQVDVLNNIDAMIDVGINFSGMPPELMEIMGGAALTPELISATTSVVGGKLAGFGSFADGGVITKPTLGLIGEAGPEAVIPLNQMGSMGGTTNVTVNMPAGVDGQAVVDAIEAYARENGAAPIATTALVRQ